MIADLKEFFGIEPARLLSESPRLNLMYVRQLPKESRTFGMMRGGEEFIGWGHERYFLAELIDAIHENTWAFVAANSEKGKKPKAPNPVERPDTRAQRKQNNTFAAMARAHLNTKKKKET